MPIFIPSSPLSGDPTLSTIMDRTTNLLQGFVRNTEQLTFLTVGANSSDTTLNVDDATQISPGLIEIDDELMWVLQADEGSATVTVAPFGRGYGGSVEDGHLLNTKVVNSPLFPRIRVAEAINSTISSLADRLWVIAYDDFSYTGAQSTYTLPAGVSNILSVQQLVLGATQMWAPVDAYRFNPFHQAGTEVTAAPSVDLLTGLQPGVTVRVTYLTEPIPFTSTDQVLSDSGLSPSAVDILVYGACWSLCVGIDAARLDIQTAMADNQDTPVPVGTASSLSKYFYTLVEQRVTEELDRLQSRYPAQAHFVS